MDYKKNILTIAGSDSSGGAGIQADLKTYEALNKYGASVITSVTAQNTMGVQHVYDLPDEVVYAQLQSVFSDITFSAVKIGMLKKPVYVHMLADMLQQYPCLTVLDPIIVSSSGQVLIDPEALAEMKVRLFPIIDLLTPNIPEAAALLNCPEVLIEENLQAACRALIHTYHLKAVLLKGGHCSGKECTDTLAISHHRPKLLQDSEAEPEISFYEFTHPKKQYPNTHGTGCTLASAIAAFLSENLSLDEAVGHAIDYLQKGLLYSELQSVGSGVGPLNHRAAGLS